MSKNADDSKRKLIRYGKNISKKHPRLRPYLVRIKKTFAPVIPRFTGWGMQTEHELPWIDEYQGEIFRKACIDIKKQFKFNKSLMMFDEKIVDSLQWRHWNVSYAIRFAIKFTKVSEVEGGARPIADHEIGGEQRVGGGDIFLVGEPRVRAETAFDIVERRRR